MFLLLFKKIIINCFQCGTQYYTIANFFLFLDDHCFMKKRNNVINEQAKRCHDDKRKYSYINICCCINLVSIFATVIYYPFQQWRKYKFSPSHPQALIWQLRDKREKNPAKWSKFRKSLSRTNDNLNYNNANTK